MPKLDDLALNLKLLTKQLEREAKKSKQSQHQQRSKNIYVNFSLKREKLALDFRIFKRLIGGLFRERSFCNDKGKTFYMKRSFSKKEYLE